MRNLLAYLLMTAGAEDGQSMVEYGLIIGLVAVVLIGALGALTGELQAVFNDIVSAMKTAGL